MQGDSNSNPCPRYLINKIKVVNYVEYKREPVRGYEEYEVDTNGVVYGKNGKPLKYSLNYRGYCIINFYVNHKRTGFGIHTLVAKQFIPNNDINKNQVNHKDGNKTNNSVDNLEWVTPKENVKHSIEILGNCFEGKNSPNSKPVEGRNIKTNEKIGFPSLADAGRNFNNNGNYRTTVKIIWKVIHGYSKSAYGYIWKYI